MPECSRDCKIPSRLDVLSVVSRVETMLQISPWVRTDSDDLFSLRQLQRTQRGLLSLWFGLKYYSWQTCAGVRRHRHISTQHEAVLHMLTQFVPSLVTRFPPFVGNQTNGLQKLETHFIVNYFGLRTHVTGGFTDTADICECRSVCFSVRHFGPDCKIWTATGWTVTTSGSVRVPRGWIRLKGWHLGFWITMGG